MRNCCIIVAGGAGLRMGTALPKQYLPLLKIPVLMHTIRKFYNYDPTLQIILVLPRNEIPKWEYLCSKHTFKISHQVIAGGETRFQSVKNGLSLALECELIAIHDGVRPLVSYATIENCFHCATKNGTAIPVVPANESIRQGSLDESVSVDRSRYFMVQTPQVFKSSIIRTSYDQLFDQALTDDASVVEKAGFKVSLVTGNRENIKITFPEDVKIAELLLRDKE
jgi:2-C-methyl-D-erythritol 4-phosphate cytidylyltransferase